MERIQLNDTCWVDVGECITYPEDYEEILRYIPKEKQAWKTNWGTSYPERRRISFGCSYAYSGQLDEGHEFPDILLDYLDMANDYADSIDWPRFNQCLVNWYPNGDAYINAHPDNESELYVNEYGETIVYGVSLTQGEGNDRTFRFRRIDEKGIKLDLKTGHGDIIVMGGLTQKEYTHEIPSRKSKVNSRISMTFRTFVEDPIE